MLMSFIEKGTAFNIEISAQGSEPSTSFSGLLYEIRGNATLFIKGDELYENFDNNPSDLRLRITFFRGGDNCSFSARFERTLKMHGIKLIEVMATTAIESSSRRSTQRFYISKDVKIYKKGNDGVDELTCEGRSYDISYDAISLFTNFDIDTTIGIKFDIEFALTIRNAFRLPAVLLRREKAPVHLHSKYTYVFSFDFSECPDEKSRLASSLFLNNLESQKG